MSIQNLPPVRRIVTAVDESGRAFIAEDGPSPAIHTLEERPGYANANLWRTLAAPADVNAPDSITEHSGVLPPEGGTIFRIIDIPPEAEDPEERRRQADMTFATMFSDADHQAGHARHPGMHSTDTVDYIIILKGEIFAIVGDDETLMRAGDVLIQRGTVHAWSNRSGGIVRLGGILVSGRR